MQVWLIHIGEDLPVDSADGAPRKFRYSYLAETLAARGHEVLRWAPTFRHNGKVHRFDGDRRVDVGDRYAIQFVHSPGYRRNVSLERIRTYRVLGNRIRQLAAIETPPDLIVAAIPSLEWAGAAVDYGQSHGIPVVIDVRDLWPDVFQNALPKAARSFGRFLLAPYRRTACRVCAQAMALTAVSQSYLNWALRLAGRQIRDRDMVVPLGFEPKPISHVALEQSHAKLRDRGIDPSRPICLFAGLFERSCDLETVMAAAQRLQTAGRTDVQFVLCGDGSKMPSLTRRAAQLTNVYLMGWVDADTIQSIASVSVIGLCTYATDALQSLPNKPFEYMASRLAIVSSLPGELATMLSNQRSGLTYRSGDADSLTTCLVELLDDPGRLASMRANAYEAWSRNYRSQDIYARFADHLEILPRVFAKAA